MAGSGRILATFDAVAMYEAMDRQRIERGLSWKQAADQIWRLSSELNERRPTDHPISPSTITGIARRGDTTCQHALFFLRWLRRTPESFLVPPPVETDAARLPDPGPTRRLRWNLGALHNALNARRQERGLTWPELARVLRCSPNQLTGIRTARYAIAMRLAMKIVAWLEQPAAAFVYAADW